jgi:hypothetical protein
MIEKSLRCLEWHFNTNNYRIHENQHEIYSKL